MKYQEFLAKQPKRFQEFSHSLILNTYKAKKVKLLFHQDEFLEAALPNFVVELRFPTSQHLELANEFLSSRRTYKDLMQFSQRLWDLGIKTRS